MNTPDLKISYFPQLCAKIFTSNESKNFTYFDYDVGMKDNLQEYEVHLTQAESSALDALTLWRG